MEFDQVVAELETLVATLERDGDERALLLLQLIDAVHRPGIELIAAGDHDHPTAKALLSMYDLVPLDEQIAVEEALDEIRPYIESHGGGLELLDVDDGVVHVRMSGACNGCAGSAITLRRGVEEILRERYEGFKEVVAHEPEGAEAGNGNGESGLLQIHLAGTEPPSGGGVPDSGLLQIENLRKPVFEEVAKLADLAPGELMAVDAADHSVLLANVDGEPYAFHNVCPTDERSPLDGGRLAGAALVCPWHNCAYDARSGKRVDDRPEDPGLSVVPIAIRDGAIEVAVNVA
ncbi:MAG: NifU family protein [Actinomycetota bacterium]|nr:NifU family protein [Actinomycetota bacterium]